MNTRRTLTTAVLVLTLAGAAQATTLYTPVLNLTGVGDSYRCAVLNTGTKPITVTVELVEGLLGGTFVTLPTTIAPGTFAEALDLNSGVVNVYCRVSGKFRKKGVQVTLCVEPAGSAGCGPLVTVP